MDKYPAHKLASLCQRMPLDVFVYCNVSGTEEIYAVRAVKSELADLLKGMDGRTHLSAELTLSGIYILF